MNKETFVRFAATVALVGSAAFPAACNSQDPTIESPNKTSVAQTAESNFQWNNLPARERLRRIATKDFPSFTDFNRQQEIILATVQEYKNQTAWDLSTSELVKSIRYLSEDDFISEVSRELGRTFSASEIAEEKRSRLAITTADGKIFINQDLVAIAANDIKLNYDPRTILEISALSHELTHKNKKTKSITFKTLTMFGKDFDTLNGFKIEGRDSQDKRVYLLGGEEAITDHAASIIVGKKMGFPYIATYVQGEELIAMLNRIANISDEEFLMYVQGKQPQYKLLEKWGALRTGKLNSEENLKNGILTLTKVALATQGLIDFQAVEREINNYFLPTPR